MSTRFFKMVQERDEEVREVMASISKILDEKEGNNNDSNRHRKRGRGLGRGRNRTVKKNAFIA